MVCFPTEGQAGVCSFRLWLRSGGVRRLFSDGRPAVSSTGAIHGQSMLPACHQRQDRGCSCGKKEISGIFAFSWQRLYHHFSPGWGECLADVAGYVAVFEKKRPKGQDLLGRAPWEFSETDRFNAGTRITGSILCGAESESVPKRCTGSHVSDERGKAAGGLPDQRSLYEHHRPVLGQRS